MIAAAGLCGLISVPASGAECLSDAEIDRAVGASVRSGAAFVDTSRIRDAPLCSGLTLAQAIQRIRATAFPEDAVRENEAREELISREAGPHRYGFLPASDAVADEAGPVLTPVRTRASRGRKQTRAVRRVSRAASSASGYYANCSAARAAGAAPIRRGDPGYSRRLDRDGDGVACE